MQRWDDWNIYGYFKGLSSPSVTLITTTLLDSPRSNKAGQTKFPTFSIKRIELSSTESFFKANSTIPASRWQPVPVFICMAGAPAFSILWASNKVCWSPSMTNIFRDEISFRIVFSRMLVLPEPGELTRFKQRILLSAKSCRLSCATLLLPERISRFRFISFWCGWEWV